MILSFTIPKIVCRVAVYFAAGVVVLSVHACTGNDVSAEQAAAPVVMTPFALRNLDGETVEADDLLGKILVINFWGIWCASCLAEMPDLQRLHEQYSADPEVEILAIDYFDAPDAVREWITEHGYTFQVLLDDDYVMDAEIDVFPTTWFVDRQGRIVHTKTGATDTLFQEFGRKVEALK